MAKKRVYMEKYFELKKNGTSIKQEFVAAFVTFCSMVYILIVNANMYTNPFGNGENILGLPFGAIYIGTALSAVIGCMLLGFIAKLPIAMASGMGLNAFFIYTQGYSGDKQSNDSKFYSNSSGCSNGYFNRYIIR